MKALTNTERISAMTAAAEAINELRTAVNENGWAGRFHFNIQYLFHDNEDKFWPMVWGIVDGDDTAVDVTGCDLYARYIDSEDAWLRLSALTPENIRAQADFIIRRMNDFISNYEEFAEEYREKKRMEEASKEQ